MKKRLIVVAVTAALVLGLAVLVVSCGGGGGGGGAAAAPANTTISTPTQAAQSTSATVNTVRSISSIGGSLSGFVSTAGPAPKFRGATVPSKFAARFAPVIKKARAMRASAQGYPMTTSCATGGTVAPGTSNSMTVDMDASGTAMTMTFDNCKEGSTVMDGIMTMSGSQNSNSGTLSIGSDDRPLTETTYASTTSSTKTSVDKTAVTITFTETAATATTSSFTMAANGWFENIDFVAHTHSKESMTNFSIGGNTSTATIGGINYDVDTVNLSGTMTETVFASDTDSTIRSQQGPNTFTNVALVFKSPSSGTGDEYMSIDGTISLSSTPADPCNDGTFTIVTNTALQIDGTTGSTKAGKMTINGNVVATFNSDGSISVSVDGSAPVVYTEQQLTALCPL